MGAWPAVVQYVADLRRFLNDGPLDKSVKDKKVLGDADGTNAAFFTAEDRLVEETLHVTMNSAEVLDNEIIVDDLILGRFRFVTPPPQGRDIRARYFYQDFLDLELIEASEMAANEIAESDDITVVPLGLKFVALKYGAHFAYLKLALSYARRMSDRFMLQERPIADDVAGRSNMFSQLAKDMYESAIKARDDFYTGHGRRNVAAFRVFRPVIPWIGPRR